MLHSNIYNNSYMKVTKPLKSGGNANEKEFAHCMYEIAFNQDKEAFGKIFNFSKNTSNLAISFCHSPTEYLIWGLI